VADALLGGVRVPPVKISEALDVYANEIMAHEVVGKSQSQRRMWKKVKESDQQFCCPYRRQVHR
jgi:hypothetical protein